MTKNSLTKYVKYINLIFVIKYVQFLIYNYLINYNYSK